MVDPAALFSRVPELVPVARRHPALAEAVATGDPHAAWRALALLRDTAAAEVATVAPLLDNRALFLRPLLRAPSLHTVLGCGTALRGRQDDDPGAGTFVATRWVTVLGLPVYPLAEYLVSGAGSGQFRVYGQVPPSRIFTTRRGVARTVGVIALLAGAGRGLEALGAVTVSVANGLPVPVTVTVGAVVVVVPPETRRDIDVNGGALPYDARLEDGTVIDAGQVRADGGGEVLVLNVLGAAPVYTTTARGGVLPGPAPGTGLACGSSTMAFPEVDVAWPADSEPALGSGGPRSVVALAPGGWLMCVGLLQARGEGGRAAELARRVASVLPDRAEAVVAAAEATHAAEGSAAALAWLLPAADRAPLDATVQGAVLSLAATAEQQAAIEARFAALQAANPDSALAAYLHAASCVDADEARERFAAAVSAFPGDARLAEAWADRLFSEGRWAEAVVASARAEELSGVVASKSLVRRATALSAAGRSHEARTLLGAHAATWAGDRQAMRLFLHLSRQAADRDAATALAMDHLREQVGAESAGVESLWLYASLGQPSSREALAALASEGDRRRLVVASRLVSDPEGAMVAARALDAPLMGTLHPPQWILLRGEAMRAGDTDLQVHLDQSPPAPATAARRAREFVGGAAPASTLLALPPEWAAAALLARSRQPGLAANEAWALRRQAMDRDPLDALVSRAARSWP